MEHVHIAICRQGASNPPIKVDPPDLGPSKRADITSTSIMLELDGSNAADYTTAAFKIIFHGLRSQRNDRDATYCSQRVRMTKIWKRLYKKGLMSKIYGSRPSSCRHRALKTATTD